MPGLILTYVWLAAFLAGPGALASPATAVEAASPAAGAVESAANVEPGAEAGVAANAETAANAGVGETAANARVAANAGVAEIAANAAAPEVEAPGVVAPRAAVPAAAEAPMAHAPMDQDPESVLRQTAAAYEAMTSMAADFSQTLQNTLLGRTTESAGRLYQEEPDKFLMDFTAPEGDVIVSDGRYFWMYFPSVDERQVLRTLRRGQGLDLNAQFIGDPVQRFEHEYHGTEAVRGREAHVFTLTPREPAGYRRMKVWIDGEDFLVRRFELYEENGNVRHLELRDMVVNPTLPDSLFEFTPPEDAIVVDRG